jgi:hypothetical protein
MIPKFLALVTSASFLLALQPAWTGEIDQAQLKDEAVGIVKKFGGSLKPQLKQAIQEGGPAQAVSVCAEKAPAIAEQLSNETGWQIKRVSLKPRNQQNAEPDAWEREVLQQFDQRQANGKSAAEMAVAEIVDGEFRFMKAQGVETVCLNCHAADIPPEVEAALKTNYPMDKARGYSLGQIRGAFSLTKSLEPE